MGTHSSPPPTHIHIIEVLSSSLKSYFEAGVFLEFSTCYDLGYTAIFCDTVAYSELKQG